MHLICRHACFLALAALLGCSSGDDSIRYVTGLWSADGGDRIAVIVQRADSETRGGLYDRNTDVPVNPRFEVWTMNLDGSDPDLQFNRTRAVGQPFYSAAHEYLTAIWAAPSGKIPLRIDLRDGSATSPLLRNRHIEALVPSPSGDVIAMVDAVLGAQDLPETDLYHVFFLDPVTLESVTRAVIPTEANVPQTLNDRQFQWINEDEFRYGQTSVFRDGRIELHRSPPTCQTTPTTSGRINPAGERLDVSYDGETFTVNVVQDGVGWPLRCAPE